MRVCWCLLAFCLLLALCLIFSASEVRADGGAPNLAYVVGTAHGIAVIDILQQKVTRTIPVVGDAHTVLLSLDGRFLYVTQPATGTVTVIVARTGQIYCSVHLPGHPTYMAMGTDGITLYIASTEGNVSTIDSTTCTVLRTFETHDPLYGLAVVAVTSGNALIDQLWIAGSNALLLYNEQGQQLASVSIAGGPQSLCVSSGLTAYVATRQGTVVAVDLSSLQVSPPLLTGGSFGTMDYNAITLEVYVPDQEADQLDVLSPFLVGQALAPQEPERVIHLNGSPQSVAISSDGQFGFVALRGGKVVMLDIPARRTIKTIDVGGTPHFIITGLYPPPGAIAPLQTALSPALQIALFVAIALAMVALLVTLWFVWRRRSVFSPRK